jgi:hypothetical protein
MKQSILVALVAVLLAGTAATAEAKKKDKHYKHHGYSERHSSRDRTRTIYIIERDRPVARTVYVSPEGRYYRSVSGRRVYVTGRYYTSYPSSYRSNRSGYRSHDRGYRSGYRSNDRDYRSYDRDRPGISVSF